MEPLRELFLFLLSALAIWALSDLFRKRAFRLTLAVGPDQIRMSTKDGEPILTLPSQLHVIREASGALRLKRQGGDTREPVREVSLGDLVETKALARAEAKTLIAAVLDRCEKRARQNLELPSNRRLRIDVRLPADWEFAKGLFDEAWLERAEQAMKHRIPNHTSFHVSAG